METQFDDTFLEIINIMENGLYKTLTEPECCEKMIW